MGIIAARPSLGKTSFLLTIIEHSALIEKQPTLLFSCEMPAVQIVERLLFSRSGVRSREIIKRGNITQLEMKH
ncbi:DnaB-like helicase C-terminal domain-containing protein, partial [Akkermansia muciniphila]|nr:DnaB-like helicase C-terminal domain-containing protein [Akkermansia muciniphila]